MYKVTYGNKYVSNTEESSIFHSQEDLLTTALDFLDSLPDYEEEVFLIDDELPSDWYESVFGECIDNGR